MIYIWVPFAISFVLFALGLSLRLPQNGVARFLVMLVKLLLIIGCGGFFLIMSYALIRAYLF